MKNSMRAGDADRTGMIRLLMSSLKNEQIKVGHELSDEEALKSFATRVEAAQGRGRVVSRAGRDDLLAKEEYELTVVAEYLPTVFDRGRDPRSGRQGGGRDGRHGDHATDGQVIGAVVKEAAGAPTAGWCPSWSARAERLVSLTLNIQEFPADLDLSKAEAAFRALATALTEADGIINLVLVDDEEIRAMNAEFAGNDYATDVLSFSYIENGGEPIEGVIGEMAISLETAERRRRKRGTRWPTSWRCWSFTARCTFGSRPPDGRRAGRHERTPAGVFDGRRSRLQGAGVERLENL